MDNNLPIPVDPGDIKKAHQAIAVVPSKGVRITLLMRRFFNVLLFHAQDEKGKETYRRELSEILSGASYTSANLEVAKSTLRSMAKTPVEWNTVSNDEGERRWGVSTLLADAEVIEKNGRLFIEWSYSPKIRPRLLDPELYVRLSLSMYSSLRSSTSAALYEVCVRYVTNHDGLTNRADWQWWRPRLTGIPDSDPEQAREYKYFKRDTLVPAIREINELTDIQVELIEHKNGRRVTDIQFMVSRKQQQGLPLDDANLVDNQLLERLARFGFSKEEAVKFYTSKDEATLRQTIDYVETRLKKTNLPPIESAAAFFREALRKGYAKSAKPAPTDIKPALPKPQREKTVDLEEERRRVKALMEFESMSQEDKQKILSKLAESNPALAIQINKDPNTMIVKKAAANLILKGRAGGS